MSQIPSLSKIPAQFVAIYDELRNEVVWMHGRWITYRDLFTDSPKRRELLSECADFFFAIIEDVLVDEIQIALSKLTDPAKQKKFENLSLERLQECLELHSPAELASTCREILGRLQQQCVPFRFRRDKQLAHLDLPTSLKTRPDPLPDISRRMIEEAMLSVRTYLNAIEMHYNDSEWGYNDFIVSTGADSLVAVLRSGLRYEELSKGRAIPFDDWRNGRWSDA